MMNQAVAKSSFREVPMVAHGGGGMLMPQNFGEVVSFSEIMARSQHAIPKHLRDVPGACLAVTMQAMRWEMDPFAVASKSYNVKDIIAYEAQLIAAVVHTRAPIKTRPDYAYSGEGQDRRCTVSAIFDDGIQRAYESPRIADILVKNSPLWKADPDQQLGYYSIRAFARRYCPEVILGVYTPEEAETFRGPENARDVTPKQTLSDRLTAGAGSQSSAAGFSPSHVISEIGSDAPRNEGGASQQTNVSPEHFSSVAETVTTQVDAALVDQAGEAPATQSNSSQTSAPQPTETDAPATNDGSPASDVAGNQPSDAPTEDDTSGEAEELAPSRLPEGWTITYAAALRRAQKPDSLPRYATDFWKQYGGWDQVKLTDARDTAKAIYDAFSQNFGNKSQIEAALREII